MVTSKTDLAKSAVSKTNTALTKGVSTPKSAAGISAISKASTILNKGTPTAPNLGAVGSNSSGNIQLQSNIEIENQAMDANEYLKQENERATQLQTQAAIEEALGNKNSRDAYQEQRGQSNAQMAFRGMKGSAALNRSAQDKTGFQKMMAEVMAKKNQSNTEASNIKTAASSWWNTEQGKLTNARQAYTDEQSKLNPTIGSTPVNSGLKATTVPTTAAKAAPKVAAKTTVVKKSVPKKTYKGKYPGPDKYKGNAKLIAAAKRKAGKK